jgi:protein TonB
VPCPTGFTRVSEFLRATDPHVLSVSDFRNGHRGASDRRQVSNMFSRPKGSALISGLIHAAVILLALMLSRVKPLRPKGPDVVTLVDPHDISRYVPRVAHIGGGGGGGGRDKTPASKGQLPRVALRQFTPPTAVIRNYNPILPVEPTLVGTQQIAAVLPNIPYGAPNGVAGPPSNGRGKNGGIGDGDDGGVGDRKGPGAGDAECCGVGDGRPHIVGKTVEPVLLVKIDPEYSDEARRAKLQGIVVLHIDVDTHGLPRNIRVMHGLGLDLDQRAVDAVRQWKFRAGTIDGKPAVTSAVVEVNFRLL